MNNSYLLPPDILNDVISPVLRDSLSAHFAASLRFGCIARDLLNEKIDEVLIEFDPSSSLATTPKRQGSDMKLFGLASYC